MSEPSDHYLRAEFMRRLPDLWPFVAASGIDGWWFWDMRHQEHEYMSPRFWSVLGYDPAGRAHSPEAWRDMLPPGDRQAAVAAIGTHLGHGTPYDLIVRYLPGPQRPGLEWVWIRCRGMVVRDDDGAPLYFLGVHQDVTRQQEEIHRLRVELIGIQERLQALEDDHGSG